MANANPPNVVAPSLPSYSDTLTWVNLAQEIITDSGVVNNRTRFLALYRALPSELQERYEEYSGTATSYADLLAALRERFADSSTNYFTKLITACPMGDLSPKDYLYKVRSDIRKSGLNLTNPQIRQVYLSGLDVSYQHIVSVFDAAHLDEGVKRAEEVYRANKNRITELAKSYAAVSYAAGGSMSQKDKSDKDQIADLSKQVSKLTTKLNQQVDSQNKVNEGASSSHFDNNQRGFTNRGYGYRGSYNHRGNNSNRGNFRNNDNVNQEQRHNSAYSRGNYTRGNYTRGNFRNNFNNRSVNSCPSLPTNSNTYDLCYAHRRFGGRAYSCHSDCDWESFRNKMMNKTCNEFHPEGECPWVDFFRNDNSKN